MVGRPAFRSRTGRARLLGLAQLPLILAGLVALGCADAPDGSSPSADAPPALGQHVEDIVDRDPPPPELDFGEVPDHSDRLLPPELHAIEPRSGPSLGGTDVVIEGRGLLYAERLTFGGVPSPDWSVIGADKIHAVTPPGVVGPADVAVEGRGGSATHAGLFEYVADVAVTAIEPALAPTVGGTPFTLTGAGLSRDVTVLIGDRAAIALQVLGDGRATGFFPPNPAGEHDVWVFAGDGSSNAVVRRAVRFREAPAVESVSPSTGPAAGGTPVEVVGRGFEPDIAVVLGGRRVDAVTSADGRRLRFATPPAQAPGAANLAVHSPVGDGGLPDAFAYGDPDDPTPRLHAVRPAQGPVDGGNGVEVLVGQVSPQARLSFGGAPAACADAESGVMRCVAPSHDAGAVSIVLKDGDRMATLPAGYTYVPPVRLTAVAPSRGAVAGGGIVTLRGEGFRVGSRVWFGPMESPQVRYIASDVATAVAPPGAAGAVDVVVTLPDGHGAAALHDAYVYEDRLRVLGIDPAVGSQAGGTYVAVLGTGFTAGLQPRVGGRPAAEPRFRGSTRYTFKTPPGDPGRADVEVPGLTLLPGAFTYFNPATLYGGVWGRRIAGAVNVTLLSGADGDPVAGAFAIVGADPATPLQGVTDANGQVTLSGPHVEGPLDVTAGKDGYESQTFVLVEGENVTFYLTPLVPPTAGAPAAAPPPVDGRIHGFVSGIDKYVPDPRHGGEIRIAYVETTREDPYRPNPDPGPGALLTGDGPYTLVSRPGDVAVVVVAGLLDQGTGVFQAFRMGVARWLYMPLLGELEDVDVELTVPLTRRLGVTLVAAPVEFEDGPNEVQSTPWFEFKPEGWYGGYNRFDGWGRDFWIESMPLFRGADFDDVRMHLNTALYRDGSRPMSMRWDKDLPWDLQLMDAGPFPGLPELTDPLEGQVVSNRRFAWRTRGGVAPDVWSLRLMTEQYAPIWRIVAPGHVTALQLPRVAALPPLPAGRHIFAFSGGLTDGWSAREWEYGDLSVRGWEAWSTVWAPFAAASR